MAAQFAKKDRVLSFVEDVGRHNAVDTLVGEMWLNGMRGDDKIFTPQVV